MSDDLQVTCRRARTSDVPNIAALHADSWRRNYRGAYLDSFLDSDVMADRLAVWTDRLAQPETSQHTTIADLDGVVVGFAHTIVDSDPTWGALLDNLHVTHELKGRGIGTQLMAETAVSLIRLTRSSGLYLWVLEQNKAAQAFYNARGGACVERAIGGPFPGGGTAATLRYVWPDPSTLLYPQ